jgi:hypothetical protein
MVGNMATEWLVHYPQDAVDTDDYSLNRPYSLYVVSIPIERRPGFYMYNVVSLMFILGTVGLGIFTVDHSLTGLRADLLLTLVLTLVALKLVISETLPQISYLTWLDKYVLSVIFFQVAEIASVFYIGHLFDGGNNVRDDLETIDNWCYYRYTERACGRTCGEEGGEGGGEHWSRHYAHISHAYLSLPLSPLVFHRCGSSHI